MPKVYNKYEKIVVYCQIINTQKLNSFTLFKNNKTKSKIKELYKLAANNTEELKVIKKLGYKNSKDPSYQKLSDRLLYKLKSSLFFLDTEHEKFSSLGVEFYKLYKNLFQHRILLMLSQRNLSMDTIEKDIDKAIEYDFPDIILQLAGIVRTYYGYMKPNESKFKFYDDLIDKNIKNYDAELLVEKYYSLLSYNYLYKKHDQKFLLNIVNEYELIKKKKISQVETYRFIIHDFQILSFKEQLLKNYHEVIRLADKTIYYFKKKPYDSFLITYFIYTDKINALIKLHKFQEAKKEIETLESQIEKGIYNWFKLKSLHFIICISLNDYNQAYLITYKVTNHKSFKLFQTLHQSWLIKEAYIHFLIKMNKIDQNTLDNYPLKSFRLGKFLNEVPIYSKDKRGLNISILIIQMLFYLADKKYNQFIDRMDALTQYSYRYLRNDETLRSNAFIKMILKIPDASWHPLRVQRHVEKFYKKLVSTPMEISDQSAEIEIIPYEHLWELVLEILERDK